jgi:predicted hydrocarbon binding protein
MENPESVRRKGGTTLKDEAILQALANAYFERAFGSEDKSRIRKKLGDVIDLLSYQQHLIRPLALSTSMGPVLFEIGKKIAKYINSKSYPLYSNLPSYRGLAEAKTLKEARLSTLCEILQAQYRTTHSGLIDLTEYEKDKLFVFQIGECADCYGFGNLGMNVCYYGGGAIAGVLEALLGRSVGFIESKCYGKGDPCCEFRYNLSKH